MTEPTSTPPSQDIRALAEAIGDLLDLPIAAGLPGDETRYRVQSARVDELRGVMRHLALHPEYVAATARTVRGIAVDRPVTYTPYKPEHVLRGGAA